MTEPSHGTVIASAATRRHTSAISPHVFARGVDLFHALQSEGAGKAGCALHPRSRVQIVQKKAHTSIQVQRRQSDFPCAVVLRLIPCSPRRSGLGLSPSPALLSANLTPALRRQDHTLLPSASRAIRQRRDPRPSHPRPTSVTIANAPLSGTGWQII